VPIGDHGQLIDVQRDRFDSVLGKGRAVGEYNRDGLADIADPVGGNDRLAEWLGRGGVCSRSGIRGTVPISAAVITACTPGIASVGCVSIARM
jgi:hypothetical protein